MSFHLQDVQVLQLKTAEAVCERARQLNELGGTESEREDKERRKLRIRDKILSADMTPSLVCWASALGQSGTTGQWPAQ
jgi:predicted O-linked N-acetylglucosamine transferase (SPINDLY family)